MGEAIGILELARTGDRLAIRFCSSMDRIDEVCSSVKRFLAAHGDLFSSHLFSINLVMREGLTNAVRHGNKNDPGKTVDVEIEIVRNQMLRVCIADQGEGFDWEKIQETTMPDDATHGRGMPIMKAYFNRFQYNQKGNILYLEKQLRPEV